MKVIFATPTLGDAVSVDFHNSSLRTAELLSDVGIPYDYVTRNGVIYLDQVRNDLLTDFLDLHPDATDLFFLDSDVGWAAAKVFEYLERPEEFLAGAYPKKTPKVDFPIEMIADPITGELAQSADGKLLRVKSAPAGFLRLKRSAVEKLAAASPKYYGVGAEGKAREVYGVFESGVGPNGWYWGEDNILCRKWLDLGGEIWVDPDIQFTHSGMMKWGPRLADYLPLYREHASALAQQRENLVATSPGDGA